MKLFSGRSVRASLRTALRIRLAAFGCIAATTLRGAAPEPPSSVGPVEIRAWLLGDEGALRVDAASDSIDAVSSSDPWRDYLRASLENDPGAREAALRALLERGGPLGGAATIPEPLRRAVLSDLRSDLALRGREALFVRRYGFYARWFNRFSYVASRTIQGNLTAAAQLPVDAVYDWTGRLRATTAERRAYRLLSELEARGRAGEADRERARALEGEVERALAALDVERGRWALRAGEPEVARFYAESAEERSPGARGAKALREEAARAIASDERGRIASVQVGGGERAVAGASPEAIRAALTGRPSGGSAEPGAAPSERVLLSLLRSSPEPESRMRSLDAIRAARGEARSPSSSISSDGAVSFSRSNASPEDRALDWIDSTLASPAANPELRWAMARRRVRGDRAAYVLLGSESGRDRAYVASSRLAQFWNAIGGLGIFYGVELAWRAGVAAFSPPAPAEEAADAAGAFLRAGAPPEKRREIAEWVARRHARAGEYDAARAALETYGALDEEARLRLSRAEAKALLQRARGLAPDDPMRARALDRAKELTEGTTLAATVEKETKRRPREDEIEVRADWATLRDWLGDRAKLPAGLPGEAAWFDGYLSNGEVDGAGIVIRAEGASPERIEASYGVRRGAELARFSEEVATADLAPELAEWIRARLAERAGLRSDLKRLRRTSIPFEFTGGAGLSGVDFHPRLLPLEEGEEAELYR